MEPPWDSGMKVCANGLGRMTKMAAHAHIWQKPSSLDDLGGWYAASGTRVLPSCSNDDPGLTLTCFMASSNLVPYTFVWEKGKTMCFCLFCFFQKLL